MALLARKTKVPFTIVRPFNIYGDAPCGELGWCDNGHIWMQQISVEAAATEDLLYVGARP